MQLPDTFPAVSDDFTGPCMIEVVWAKRTGRGRFWRPRGYGYTDDPSQAGVYTAEAARARCEGSDRIVPIDALAALKAEQARLWALSENTRIMIEVVRASGGVDAP